MIKLFWPFLIAAMLIVSARVSHAQEKHIQIFSSPPQSQFSAVALDLITRKQNFAVGEKWSVFATVGNKSDVPIWIAPETSLLTIPTEILGESRRFFAQFAFLPTLGDKVSDKAIRINPGEEYVIEWYVDGLDEPGSGNRIPVGTRLFRILKEFIFFKPDEYPLTAIVHYWKAPPSIKDGLYDLSRSEMVSKIRIFRIDGSPLVLVLGAALGGLLAFVVRNFVSPRMSSANLRRSAPKYLIGLVSTMVYCAVGVILLERLAKSDFPVAVAVKDWWGAIAIGLVLEWWGLKALRRSFESKDVHTRSADEPTPNLAVEGACNETARPSP